MRIAAAALFLVLGLAASAIADEVLPKPDSLEPAVRFWTRVYTEVDAGRGLIHDAEYLDVVYAVIDVPRYGSNRSREQRVEREKSRIRAALRTLATGKRSGLSALEAEVLARWPEGISNAALRGAVDNVRFQLGQADRYRDGLVRSGAWRDYIEKTMVEYDVPVELAALPHVESSFNPGAYSRIGAAGLWQFTRSTGRLFMHVDDVLDERLDPHRATIGAARLLRKNYELTGAWPLAITSYNHGAGGMQRAARTLGTRDIGVIVRQYKSRSFGFASRNFYASFLAALHVDQNASRYFGEVQRHAPVEFERVPLPYYYPARSLSRALGVDMDMLRESNPALRPAVWQGSKHVPRGYSLQLPAGSLRQPATQLLALVPDGERLVAQHRDRYYRVRRGDTLSKIASRNGTTESRLMAVNNLRSRNLIRAGQVLVLPDQRVTYYAARDAGSRTTIEAENTLAAAVPAVAEPTPAGGIYAVRRGDTLASIARRYGTTEQELAELNGLRNRHRIQVGQSLRVPGAVAVVASASEPELTPELAPAATPSPAPSEPVPAPRDGDVVIEALAAGTPASAEPAPHPEPVPAPQSGDAEIEVPVRVAADDAPKVVDAGALIEQASAETEAAVEDEAGQEDIAEEAEPEPVEVASVQPPAPAPSGAETPGDPSDYSVHPDGRVTVQANETLGHYAEWLEVSANALRKRNGMRAKSAIVIGRKVKLDLSRVSAEEFEQRRLAYHRTLQEEFFEHFVVTGTEQHVLRKGETLWYLAERKYRVPVWLLRQYNPDLDFGSLMPGARMVVPMIEPRGEAPAEAEAPESS